MLRNALYKKQGGNDKFTDVLCMCHAYVLKWLAVVRVASATFWTKMTTERAIHKETMSALRIVRSLQDTQTPNISILGQWYSTWLHNHYTQPCLKASLWYYSAAISRLHNCTSPVLLLSLSFIIQPLFPFSLLCLSVTISLIFPGNWKTFLLVILHLLLALTHSMRSLCTRPSPRICSLTIFHSKSFH